MEMIKATRRFQFDQSAVVGTILSDADQVVMLGEALSQMLTLFTTPVVYLAFDRLRLRIWGKQHGLLDHGAGPVPSAAD